jgi:4,4-dimethyl-9beta,19-cyclopropylsterol-4alpha-methyl oxidase
MLPYATAAEAEAALGRAMTAAESLWFRYSAGIPDYVLFWHNILFLFVVFTLAPLPVALLELRAPAAVGPFKLQPKVRLSREEFFRCYRDVMRLFFLVIGPLQLVSYPTVKVRFLFFFFLRLSSMNPRNAVPRGLDSKEERDIWLLRVCGA